MRKLVAVAAAVLVLAGCTAAPSERADTARIAPDSPDSAEPYETTGPAEPELTAEETELLGYLRDRGEFDLSSLNDADLVAVAWHACELFAQGVGYKDMELVDVESVVNPNYVDSEIAGLASQTICPEYDVTLAP